MSNLGQVDATLSLFGIDPEQVARRLGINQPVAGAPPGAPPRPNPPAPGPRADFSQPLPVDTSRARGMMQPTPPPAAPATPGREATALPADPNMERIASEPRPAEKAYEGLLAQGPPRLHGWKLGLDVASQAFPIGQRIERAVPGSPGYYAGQLARSEQAATSEEARIGKEATMAEQADIGAERRAKAIKDLTPPPPPKPTADLDKKIEEYTDDQTGKRVTVMQKPDGSVYEIPSQGRTQMEKTGTEKPEIESQIGPKPTTPQYGTKTFPSVAAAQKAWGRDYEKIIDREAEATGMARGEAYVAGRRATPVRVLDTWNGNRPITVSAGEAEDNPARYVTEPGGEKALPREALINDIRVSATNVGKNLAVLDRTGIDRAALAAALADPRTTFQQWAQGIPRGTLNDQGQQFVADLFNLREQAMAMRSVLGAGQGSEDLRNAILATLPGIASGSSLARKQLDNLQQVLNRLEQGIPKVPLRPGSGPNAPGAGANPGAFQPF